MFQQIFEKVLGVFSTFSEQSVIFVMACQVVKIMHNARKLEWKEEGTHR